MRDEGAHDAGTGRPAKPAELAGTGTGREMRGDRGGMPCQSDRTPVLHDLVSSTSLQFGATRGAGAPHTFVRGTSRGAQREKVSRASPSSGRNSGNRGWREHAPAAGSCRTPVHSAPSLTCMPRHSCLCTHRGAARLSAHRLWRALVTCRPVETRCWKNRVRLRSTERRRSDV